MSSIFTKIIEREIPADIEYEDEDVIVIHDIAPQAKHHLLIIPKKEIATLDDIDETNEYILRHMFEVARTITRKKGISQGYKAQFNVGKDGGQEVMHLHLHILSDI